MPDMWSEFSQDLLGESFMHSGKEPFKLDYVDNGMSACELVKQAKMQNSPFAVGFLDVRLSNGWGRDWNG